MKSLLNTSLLEVSIETGRLHQIRRHLAAIGHPVMGDPRYGEGNKNADGLKLVASRISFQYQSKPVECELSEALSLF